jgi:hypothetical protein
MEGMHEGMVTQFSIPESLGVVTFQGWHQHLGGGRFGTCRDGGIVNNVSFFCDSFVPSSCPEVEGSWRVFSQINWASPVPPFPSGADVKGGEGLIIANCLPDPPPCRGAWSATKRIALDLETGRVLTLDPGDVLDPKGYQDYEKPLALQRSEEIGGKSYFLEEWAFLELGDRAAAGAEEIPVETVAASSPLAEARASLYAEHLRSTPGVKAATRYLLIEAAYHRWNRVGPLVRLKSLMTGEPVEARHDFADGRVVLRARFSEQGELEAVEALEGDPRDARVLAQDLVVELAPHSGPDFLHQEHCSVVFAVYTVRGGAPRLLSAWTTLPQCCCPPWICEFPDVPPPSGSQVSGEL